jgi:hypothetical protein
VGSGQRALGCGQRAVDSGSGQWQSANWHHGMLDLPALGQPGTAEIRRRSVGVSLLDADAQIC